MAKDSIVSPPMGYSSRFMVGAPPRRELPTTHVPTVTDIELGCVTLLIVSAAAARRRPRVLLSLAGTVKLSALAGMVVAVM